MVNLTAMAKAYPDKNLSTIVNSQEISDYCTSLSKLKNFSLADLLIVKRGGDNPGTWAHRLVAIRVAQKLNSDLAVWANFGADDKQPRPCYQPCHTIKERTRGKAKNGLRKSNPQRTEQKHN